MKYAELYATGREMLEKSNIQEFALDARLLLEHVCGTNRNDLLAHPDRDIDQEKQDVYLDFIAKRATHIPLQYLTGMQEFMGLEFKVNNQVLIPRQDTEILVEEVLRDLHDGSRILDMCTGSGCILISLLHYSNDCEGTGVDLSQGALEVASENAHSLLGSKTDGTVCRFVQSDLFREVAGKYDILVSNPPYIRSEVVEELMEEVRNHEPRMALDGMEDGLFFYRKITADAKQYLMPGGSLFFEIGYDQGDEVKNLLLKEGFTDVRVVKDFAGLDRVVCGRFEII